MDIVFWGRGGQGAVTAAALLVLAASYEGKYAQAYPFFGAEKRGAPVNAFLRISARPIFIRSRIYEPDCIIVLDARLPQLINVASGMKAGGTAVLNASCSAAEVDLGVDVGKIAVLDATRIAGSIYGHRPISMTNMVMVGAFSCVTGEVSLTHVLTAIKHRFKGKITEQNMAAAKEGYTATEILDRTAVIKQKGADLMQPRTIKLAIYKVPVATVMGTTKTSTWCTTKPVHHPEKCVPCNICAKYCPEAVIMVDKEHGFHLDYDYCKGCGICANECPRGAIEMIDEV